MCTWTPQQSALACENAKEGGTPFALNVSPIDSLGCLPGVYEYQSLLMKVSLHSFELIPANIKEAR